MTFSRIIFLIVSYFLIITSEGSYFPGRQKRGHVGSWNYVDKGPDVWGSFCQTGKKQSPINIKLGESIIRNYPSFKFNEHYLSKQRFHATNNGHTIYVSLKNDTIKPIIYGGGLPGSFIFEQLHMHWESEHEFDGKRTSMEMHIVHYNSKYASFGEASTQPDGIAVLAVFFDESDETDPLMEDFFDSILEDIAEDNSHHLHPPPEVPSDPLQNLSEEDKDSREDSETHELFALRDLLPKKISRFFRYEGSLTTPSCDEVVQWTLFINRFPISRHVLDQVITIHDHDNHAILRNFRPPQNLYGREVFIQLKDHDELESETVLYEMEECKNVLGLSNPTCSGVREDGLKGNSQILKNSKSGIIYLQKCTVMYILIPSKGYSVNNSSA